MKKVFLSLAFVMAMSVSFVSCKETKTETEEVVAPTEEVAPVEEVAPATADTTAVEATPATDAAAPATEAPAAK
ncbi:MAG TPA: hypothetical protein VK623_11975 [Flavobacterium sp.]|nr:hypothetical protein [Flavobacterium sp.]